MPSALEIENYPQRNRKEVTNLTADVAVAAVALPVKSSKGFSDDDPVVIGRAGTEATEIKLLTATPPNASTLTVAPLTAAHRELDEVLALYGDQVRIYRAANVDGTTPADAAFSTLLATVDLDSDEYQTYYEDAAGSVNYWYKAVYYNSVTEVETSLADAEAIRGGEYGHYTTLDAIRKAANFQNADAITDDLIDEYRESAESEVNGYLESRYALPLSKPVPGIIRYITKILAAGQLINDEYGRGTIDESPGDGKLKEARALLDRIQTGKMRLVGQTHIDLESGGTTGTTDTGGSPSGWPNRTTELHDETMAGDIDNPKVTINEKF